MVRTVCHALGTYRCRHIGQCRAGGIDDEGNAVDRAGVAARFDVINLSILGIAQHSKRFQILLAEDQTAVALNILVAAVGIDDLVQRGRCDLGDFDVGAAVDHLGRRVENTGKGVGCACADNDLTARLSANGTRHGIGDDVVIGCRRKLLDLLRLFAVGGDFCLVDINIVKFGFCRCRIAALGGIVAFGIRFDEAALIALAAGQRYQPNRVDQTGNIVEGISHVGCGVIGHSGRRGRDRVEHLFELHLDLCAGFEQLAALRLRGFGFFAVALAAVVVLVRVGDAVQLCHFGGVFQLGVDFLGFRQQRVKLCAVVCFLRRLGFGVDCCKTGF